MSASLPLLSLINDVRISSTNQKRLGRRLGPKKRNYNIKQISQHQQQQQQQQQPQQQLTRESLFGRQPKVNPISVELHFMARQWESK